MDKMHAFTMTRAANNIRKAKVADLLITTCNNIEDSSYISLFEGLGGQALLLMLTGRELDIQKFTTRGEDMVDTIITNLGDEIASASFADGFTGIAWLINYMQSNEMLNIYKYNITESLDEYVAMAIKPAAANSNYDLLDGLIGFGVYFLSRYPNDFASRQLQIILGELELLAESESQGVNWPLKFRSIYDVKEYNLGMAHGLPSIISFLSKLCLLDIERNRSLRLIEKSIQWMQVHQNDECEIGSFYCATITKEGPSKNKSSLSWCYGDLCISLALIHAYKATMNKEYYHLAKRISLFSATRQMEDSLVYNNNQGYVDTCFCHGTSGLALIFKRLADFFGSKNLEMTHRYWLGKTIDLRDGGHQDPILFYSYKNNGSTQMEWHNNSGLLEGASGVGLVLLNSLSLNQHNWDQIFFTDI